LDKGRTREEMEAILPELLFADKLLNKFCPEIHDEMVKGVNQTYRLAGTCFTRAALNSGDATTHRDFGIGIDVLLYTGDWLDGELCIPQLGIKVSLQKGDAVILDSRLFHEVLRHYGTRFSMVFFAKKHNAISAKLNNLYVPQELEFLSKVNFGLF